MRGIYFLTEDVLASQEGLYSMDLVMAPTILFCVTICVISTRTLPCNIFYFMALQIKLSSRFCLFSASDMHDLFVAC